MPMFKLACLFIIGLVCSEYIDANFIKINQLVIISAILLGIAIVQLNHRQLSSLYLGLNTIIIGCLLGLHAHTLPNTKIELGKKKIYVLKVVSHEIKEDQSKVVANILFSIEGNKACTTDACKIIFWTKNKALRNNNTGDIMITQLSINQISENKNPLTFNYKKFLSRKNIHYSASIKPDTEILQLYTTPKTSISNLSLRSKKYISKLLKRHIPDQKNYAIAAAMILGDKSEIDESLYQAFSKTGAIHTLAVSGLHVGMISLIILFLCRPLKVFKTGKYLILIVNLISIWSFVYLTGCGPPAVRAGCMISLYCVAKILGRYNQTWNTLGTAAFIILLIKPQELFSISFQFSFLALSSILFFYPRLDKLILVTNPVLLKFKQLIVLSLSAQILIIPASIYYFHYIPNYFWLSGIIAVPAAGVILSLGILLIITSCSSLLDFLHNAVGQILNFIIEQLNFCILKIQSLPFHEISNIWLEKTDLILIYLGLIICIIGFNYLKFWTIAFGCLLLISQNFIHLKQKFEKSKSSKLMVYDTPKGLLIDLCKNGYHIQMKQENVSPKDIKRNSEKFRIKYGPQKAPPDLLTQVSKGKNIYYFENKVIVINPTKSIKVCQPIDFLILSKIPDIKISEFIRSNAVDHLILKNINPKMIDLPPSSKRINKVHSIDIDGPFLKSFSYE